MKTLPVPLSLAASAPPIASLRAVLRTALSVATAAALAATLPAPAARAADIPRFRITIPGGVARDEPGGALRFLGTASVLVRVRGLAVLIDPGSEVPDEEVRDADVVLLSGPAAGGGGALAARPVVALPEMAALLRGQGWRSVYPLDTWEGITIRKGDTRLRLTALPDPRGVRADALAAMLDFGPACRVLVHHAALTRDEFALIPQRYPGARLALLRQDGTPLLMTVEPGGRAASVRHPVARGEPYRFGTPDCR